MPSVATAQALPASAALPSTSQVARRSDSGELCCRCRRAVDSRHSPTARPSSATAAAYSVRWACTPSHATQATASNCSGTLRAELRRVSRSSSR